MKQDMVGSVFAPLLTLLLCVCPFLTRLKLRRLLGPAGIFLSSKIADKVWELPVHLTKAKVLHRSRGSGITSKVKAGLSAK